MGLITLIILGGDQDLMVLAGVTTIIGDLIILEDLITKGFTLVLVGSITHTTEIISLIIVIIETTTTTDHIEEQIITGDIEQLQTQEEQQMDTEEATQTTIENTLPLEDLLRHTEEVTLTIHALQEEQNQDEAHEAETPQEEILTAGIQKDIILTEIDL